MAVGTIARLRYSKSECCHGIFATEYKARRLHRFNHVPCYFPRMSDRQFALKSKIGELRALLETIQANGVQSVVVHTAANEPRTYNIEGIRDAINNLFAEIISSPESAIPILEEKYEHDRADVLRIIGRLAEMAASASGVDSSTSTRGRVSTF
jgi:hypothetical protein